MYGFTNHNDKADMEKCFKDTPEFEADMCDVYANLITKDNQKVLIAIQNLVADLPEFHTYMQGCAGFGTVLADWNVVATWFKYWKAQGMMKVYA